VREAGVYCELVPGTAPWAELRERHAAGLILSGGPASVYEEGAPQVDPAALRAGIPVLGICYGMQLIAHRLGGEVAPATRREYGPAVLAVGEPGRLFKGLPAELPVWMNHGDHVLKLPPGFRGLASSGNSPVAAFANQAGVIGIQFHPEVVHTPDGREMIRNFVLKVCGCSPSWTPGSFITESIERIRAHERALVADAISRLGEVPGLRLHGPLDAAERGALVSFVIEGASWIRAVGQIRREKAEAGRTLLAHLRVSDDPTVQTVFYEDTAALIGLVLAFGGVGLHLLTGSAFWDGLASLLIGVLLAAVAYLLGRTNMGLLIGQQADPRMIRAVYARLSAKPEVQQVVDLLTMLLGTDKVLLCVRVDFIDRLSADEVERACVRIDDELRQEFSDLDEIFIEPVPRTDPRLRARVVDRYGSVLENLR